MSSYGVFNWVGDFLVLRDLLQLRQVSKTMKFDISLVRMLYISSDISTDAILFALSLFKNIRVFMLQNGSNLSNHSLSDIARRGAEKMEIHSFGKASSNAEGLLGPYCPHHHVCHLRQLRIMRAVCTGPFLLNALAPLVGLKILYLERIHLLSDSDFHLIVEHCSSLEELSVRKCMLLHPVAFVPNFGCQLQSLSITECPSLRSVIFSPKCSRLTQLYLSNTSITQETAEHAMNTLPLSTLDVSHCSLVTCLKADSGTIREINLRACFHLSRLEVSCCSLAHVDILLCKQLSMLLLQSSMITHIDLTMLTSLRLVTLQCSELQTLDLSGCIQLNSVKTCGSCITLSRLGLVEDRTKQIHSHADMLFSLSNLLPLLRCSSSSVGLFPRLPISRDSISKLHPRSASL